MGYEDHESIAFLRNENKQYIKIVPIKEEDGPDLDLPYAQEAIHTLIKSLAESYSQHAIAKILNERGLLREGGKRWKQFHVSRYFKAHGIAAIHKWKGMAALEELARRKVYR